MSDADTTLRLRRLDAFAFRAPTPEPVATSFGTMRDRPAVFIRLEDRDGAWGWGEAFANWPVAAAEHRVNLAIDDMAALVLGHEDAGPEAMFDRVEAATHIRALQSGEWGPFRQVAAAIDTAVWDLVARRVGLRLADILSDGAATHDVDAYASGIPCSRGAKTVSAATPHRAFKVKVGYDDARDLVHLAGTAAALPTGAHLMADANQAWDAAAATRFLDAAAGMGLRWMEEPIPADAPPDEWVLLAGGTIPLAAGENIAGQSDFAAVLKAGYLGFLQPDLAKWGGPTGFRRVARLARGTRTTICPHFLGGGIGLTASAHALAAVGGDGLLEMDVNPNPLRDAFVTVLDRVSDGRFVLAAGPGLGIEDLPGEIAPLCTHHRTVTE